MAKKKDKIQNRKWVLQAQLISALRRMFLRSPMFSCTRNAAKFECDPKKNKNGKLSTAHRVEFKCSCCGKFFKDGKVIVENIDKKGRVKKVKKNSIAVDHFSTVVPLEGMPLRANGLPDWNVIIDRMFLGILVWEDKVNTYEDIKEKASILCHLCHDIKTLEENKQRKEFKKAGVINIT